MTSTTIRARIARLMQELPPGDPSADARRFTLLLAERLSLATKVKILDAIEATSNTEPCITNDFVKGVLSPPEFAMFKNARADATAAFERGDAAKPSIVVDWPPPP